MKWAEEKLIKVLVPLAAMCFSGFISSEEKEDILDEVLDTAGWTRAELQDLNRRRQARNN